MQPYFEDSTVRLHHGDCLDVMASLPDDSVDAIVTDPPYGLGFMGKAWDDLPPGLPWAQECLRVLKPGGHLLAFGGTRTWHRLAVAVEDAGFEVRDSIAWLYGSGFPKSLDVSKAIDKASRRDYVLAAVDLGLAIPGNNLHDWTKAEHSPGDAWWEKFKAHLPAEDWRRIERAVVQQRTRKATGRMAQGEGGYAFGEDFAETAPATPLAQQWAGWGTALKPAFEPIVVARKPLVGTVASNVLAHGTGALNIDGTRVATDEKITNHARSSASAVSKGIYGDSAGQETHQTAGQALGRWPANVLLDGSQAEALDEQSGTLTSGSRKAGDHGLMGYMGADVAPMPEVVGDSGGASRFFPVFRYQAKAPTRERPSYVKDGETSRIYQGGGGGIGDPRCTKCGKQKVNVPGAFCVCPEPDFQADPSKLNKVAHPTVKPVALMQWLVRLVTPPGGVVLEPFAGSGTTVEACLLEGFRCIAIEREADYLPLIEARIDRATSSPATDEDAPPTLFDATA